jgi:hypothetical protein
MTSMEQVEKFLAEDQLRKLEGQLYPVCEKHCPQSLNCSRGISVECPVQVYIEHLRCHTRSSIHAGIVRKANPTPVTKDHSFSLKNELDIPEYGRIKAKLRKISMIRGVDSMIVRGYLYTCLDRISEKCRNFEEDMRWRLAEKAVEERDTMI